MKITKNLLKQIINEELRNVLKEADAYSCNKHSLGFIDDKGNFIDLEPFATEYQKRTNVAYTHGDYLESVGLDWTPDGWIKISNWKTMKFEGPNLSNITYEQIDGFIEMWMSCSKFSKELKKNASVEPITIYTLGGEKFDKSIDEFLYRYGDEKGKQLQKMFNFLEGLL